MKRDLTEAGVLIAGLSVLLLQSVWLSNQRHEANENARRNGLSCMALVDPTITPRAAGEAPVLQGVDPQTAVFLQRVDPEAAAFFHSHWSARVTTLDGPTYRRCFGATKSNNQAGTAAIFLDQDRLPSPELRAVAIAHELVHAEHGHRDTPQGRHRFLHLFITEEGEAHLADQEAAIRLHTKPLDSPLIAAVLYIGTLPLLYGWFIWTVYRLGVLARRSSKERALRSARFPMVQTLD